MQSLFSQDTIERNELKIHFRNKYEKITEEYLGHNNNPNKLQLFLDSNKRFLIYLEEQLRVTPKREHTRLKKDIKNRKELIAYLEGRVMVFNTPIAEGNIINNGTSTSNHTINEKIQIVESMSQDAKPATEQPSTQEKPRNILYRILKVLFTSLHQRGPFLKRK